MRHVATIALALLTGACGPGAVAEGVRPKEKSAAEAVGETPCDPASLDGGASPLIVDLRAAVRSDLETAMAEGMGVVSYSCDGLKVLPDCRVDGNYGYRALTVKTETVQLESSDEVGANFSGGPVFAASVRAEMARGSKLNLAYVLVGKQSSTRLGVTRDELRGQCAKATHFVRRADVGAFAFATSTEAKVASAAEIFGQGAKAGASSIKRAAKSDGDPKACEGASKGDKAPPSHCESLIRLTLLPIAAAGKKATSKRTKGATDDRGCPSGFVLTGGKCARPSPKVKAYLCKRGDADDCRKQCLAGDAPSCGRLGETFLETKVPELGSLAAPFEAACAGDEANACAALGHAAAGANPDEAGAKKALALWTRACLLGEPDSCSLVADYYLKGRGEKVGIAKDPKKYVAILSGGCEASSALACAELGAQLLMGKAIPQNVDLGMDYGLRACLGGFHEACLVYGAMHAGDRCEAIADDMAALCSQKRKPNPAVAKRYVERACKGGLKAACAIKL